MKLCFLLLLCAGSSAATKGRDFVVAFIEHFRTGHLPQIFFIILSDNNATVHIESSGFNINDDIFIEGFSEYKYATNADYYYQGNLEIKDMTFHITSTEDITLFCYNYMVTRGDGYIAIPVPYLSTDYLVVTHSDDDTTDAIIELQYTAATHTAFLVIATVDKTKVNISLKVRGTNMAGGCGNGQFLDGEMKSFVLNKYQVIGAYCDDDITGTVINSDRPVAVLSGHNYKRFANGVSEHLVEMLLPVRSLGRSYFLPEYPMLESEVLYRVIGSQDGTRVRSPSGKYFTVDARGVHDLEVNSTTGSMYIEANNPVMVVQFMRKIPAMSLVPPVSLYSSTYDVARPTLHSDIAVNQYELLKFYLTVVVPTEDVLGLRPNIFPQFEVIKGSCFAHATVDLDNGFHRLSHVDNVQFGVMIYFEANWNGAYTHPGGYNLTDDIGKTTCPQSTVCSDGTPYPCSCAEGFFIYQCPDTAPGCDNQPCQYNSSCVDDITTYRCDCVNGSGGAHCEIDTFDHCEGNACVNASCIDEIDGYRCSCTEGFQGTYCDIDDPCLPTPCLNNGTCTQTVDGFNCSCPPGIEGNNCENVTNPCLSAPCQNNGTCTQTVDGFNCTCLQGIEGSSCEKEVDPCLLTPCQNNGTCNQTANGFSCSCPPGTVGDYCETEADACLSTPCQNNGTCTTTTGGFNCSCPLGIEGNTCENVTNPCLSAPCQNNGTCTKTPDDFNCTCPPGFEGSNCEKEVDACVSTPCQNNGTCTQTTGGFSCSCPPWIGGSNCEKVINPCLSAPCQNNGTCTQTADGFNCTCPPGIEGSSCEKEADSCLSTPCQNNGTCTQTANGHNCSCPPGTVGDNCEIEVDACISTPCQNNGTCTQTTDGFKCSCPPGIEGYSCEKGGNPCLSSPCKNSGTCTKTTDGFNCSCPPGTEGSYCEIEVNPCLSAPCKNNGICTQTTGGFNCSCPPGIEGSYCEIDINECSSNPCQNDGTCIDNVNSFDCLCSENYGGVLCDTLQTCGCGCFKHNLTDEELAEWIKWLRSFLLLDRSKLSATIRKKISIMDDRPLPTGIGCGGVVFLVLGLGLIVLMDMTNIRKAFTYRFPTKGK